MLGYVLAAFGLGEGPPNQDLNEVKRMLDELGRQVTELTGRVELAGFSALVHQTDVTIGQIDSAMSDLLLLANLAPGDPTKPAFTQVILGYIESHLRAAPDILNHVLGSHVPLADNLIKSASRAVSTRERFFDAQSSDLVKSIYDYYAGYQAKLAILLTEYYHAKPDTYSPAVIKAKLDAIEGNVTTQATSLKPRVPDGTVLDTQTGVMWIRSIDGSPLRSLYDLAEIVTKKHRDYTTNEFRLRPAATHTALPGLPFANWGIPTAEDLNRLLSHRTGDGVQWLADRARISKKLLDAANSHVWVRDTFHVFAYGEIEYRLYSLRAAVLAETTRVKKIAYEGPFARWPEQFRRHVQGILYRREPIGDEAYWWR